MKTTFRFIIAAMAAIAVFSSCQKELANDTANKTTDGVRTISVQFDNSTKATLDGFTPKFEENDAIRVSNNTTSEVCTLSVTGTFTTTLSGELTAIYPADAADFTPGTPDGKITGFKVSTSQTGKLTDAIIAKATIAENSSVATFQGQTAVFRITPGAGNSTKYVEVITAGPEIANTTTTDYTKKNKIHVETDDDDEVFVSVLVPDGGLKLRDLSFADGSKMKTVNDATYGATAINLNTIYTITSSGWNREYVEINSLKWATMNIGATSPTDNGYYFFWGGTEGYKHDGSKWVKASDNTTELSGGFCQDKAPYYSSSAYTKYTGTSGDGKSTLDLADDAANANWGGSWRMPTRAEFNALGAGNWVTSPGKGRTFGTSSNTIFLPAAGYGDGSDPYSAGGSGYYWSSSLGTDIPSFAYYLFFTDGDAFTNYDYRYYGQSVRALSE